MIDGFCDDSDADCAVVMMLLMMVGQLKLVLLTENPSQVQTGYAKKTGVIVAVFQISSAMNLLTSYSKAISPCQ